MWMERVGLYGVQVLTHDGRDTEAEEVEARGAHGHLPISMVGWLFLFFISQLVGVMHRRGAALASFSCPYKIVKIKSLHI